MVNPYSAGTLTLQEAPSFAWRTNGFALTRKPRQEAITIGKEPLARLVGFSALLAGGWTTSSVDGREYR